MSSNNFKAYFAFRIEPFANTLQTKHLMELPSMLAVKNRLDYCLDIGGCLVVTGEVGAGKSTSLRWSTAQYHPSEVLTLNAIAGSGSFLVRGQPLRPGFMEPSSQASGRCHPNSIFLVTR
jgi:ABC-type multidrug transport system ATPase subunit